jgi:dihydropyrimidine dehydrogenase (NAD+) subunit PreA
MSRPDITASIAGITSPNPFWLASAPPTNSAYQVRRAFEAGWGGVVWKTLGHDPAAVNVSSRYGALDYDGRKMVGFNNIELITDRSLEDNLAEIRQIKREFPKHAVLVSLMVESNREAWHDIVKRVEDAGADGLELNFGCPHGMSERGMGSAVGQPEYTCMVTEWAKEVAQTPVFVKLTPNVTDVRVPGRAARKANADAISLINTINSIMGVDLKTLAPMPQVAGRGSHGGYCGPAVKPIALNMVQQIASDPAIGLPVSGIGGIQTWQDAVEFMLLGAGSVQVCTAAMHYGFRIVEQLESGLVNWMREQGFSKLDDFVGASVGRVGTWNELDLAYKVVADIDQDACIHCGLCYIACEDGAHQSISRTEIPLDDFMANGLGNTAVMESGRQTVVAGAGAGYVNHYEIKKDTCVGCNLCSLVCPVSGCITMEEADSGLPSMNWSEYQAKLAAGEVAPIQPPGHV